MRSSASRGHAFTLLELMVSATLFVVILGIVMQITNHTSEIWRASSSRIQAFQEARTSFESLTRRLGQATLNTYYDYYDNSTPRQQRTPANAATFTPFKYDRASDLHFISGDAKTLLAQSTDRDGNPILTQTQAIFFQAPLGYSAPDTTLPNDPYYRVLDNALNACGYFLQFDAAAAATIPSYVQPAWPGYKPRYRYRLMEMVQPTEELSIFDRVPGRNDWFVKQTGTNSRILAENAIALVLLPMLPAREDDPSGNANGVAIAPNYNYNSRVPVGTTSPDPSWANFPADEFTSFPADGNTVRTSRHHQLPPLMKVVMVFIDEGSASRLQGSRTSPPPELDLSGLFLDATKLSDDIAAVEGICNAIPGNPTGNTQRLNYRVFTTDLIMREAKWSKD